MNNLWTYKHTSAPLKSSQNYFADYYFYSAPVSVLWCSGSDGVQLSVSLAYVTLSSVCMWLIPYVIHGHAVAFILPSHPHYFSLEWLAFVLLSLLITHCRPVIRVISSECISYISLYLPSVVFPIPGDGIGFYLVHKSTMTRLMYIMGVNSISLHIH